MQMWNCWRPRRRDLRPFGAAEVAAMSAATSPGTSVWPTACGGSAPPGAWSRSSFYAMTYRPARRAAAGKAVGDRSPRSRTRRCWWRSKPTWRHRPGSFEGYRKVWARLRVCRDIRVARKRVLHGPDCARTICSRPHRCRHTVAAIPMTVRSVTPCPEPHVLSTDGRSGVHGISSDDGWGWIFIAVEHSERRVCRLACLQSAATASPPCSRISSGLT